MAGLENVDNKRLAYLVDLKTIEIGQSLKITLFTLKKNSPVVEAHRIGNFPSGRKRLIEVGYPTGHFSGIRSDTGPDSISGAPLHFSKT